MRYFLFDNIICMTYNKTYVAKQLFQVGYIERKL